MPGYMFNTTALSNCAAAKHLDLLADRYRGRAFTTIEVGNEVRRGVNAGYSYLELARQQLETVSSKG